MFCISLFEPDYQRLLRRVEELRSTADLLEIRIDALSGGDFELLPEHVKALKTAAGPRVPLLFTNRLAAEGGAFTGDEEKRLSWLKTCINSGADLIDLELNTHPRPRDELIQYARAHGVKPLISHHDFSCTPPIEVLKKAFDQALALGPDIIKIITTPLTPDDLVAIMALYPHARGHHTPLIAFGMGELGKITRVLSLVLGAPFTYCAPPGAQGTAPGQLDVETIRGIFKSLSQSSS